MSTNARIPRLRLIETPKSVPQYEVRIRYHGLGDTEIEVWRMPSPATPQLTTPTRLAGLRGEALEMVEHRVFGKCNVLGCASLRYDLFSTESRWNVVYRDTTFPRSWL